MKTTRSRLVAIGGVVIVAALGLSACSSSAAPASTASSASDRGKTISVWFPGTDPGESKLVEQTLVPQFTKQTGITVDVTYVDYSNLSTKISAALAAGTAPDIFGNGPAVTADLVTNGRILSLQSKVAALSAADRADLSAALTGGQVAGKQYLMPLQMSGSVLAYSKADFTAAGLDPNKPPTTWEGLLADAKKLTKRDSSGAITHSGLLLPSDPIGREQSFATLLAGAGGTLIDQKTLTSSFNTAAGKKALNYYTSLFQGKNAVSAGLGVTYSANAVAQQPLELGTASITLLASNAVAKINAADPKLDLGVMAPLKFEGQKNGAAFGGAGPGLMINADSKLPDASWKFIQFMLGKKVNLQYVQSFGGIPIRSSATSSSYITASPVLSSVLKNAKLYVPNPNVPGWLQARDLIDSNLEQALNQKTTTAETLSAMTTAVDGVLKASK